MAHSLLDRCQNKPKKRGDLPVKRLIAIAASVLLLTLSSGAQASLFSFEFSATGASGVFGTDDFTGVITIHDIGGLDEIQNQSTGGVPALRQNIFHTLVMDLTLSNGFDAPNSVRLDDPSVNFIDIFDPAQNDRVEFRFSEDTPSGPQFMSVGLTFTNGFNFDFGNVGDPDSGGFVDALTFAVDNFTPTPGFSVVSFSDFGTFTFGNADITGTSQVQANAVPVPGVLMLLSVGVLAMARLRGVAAAR